LVSSLIVFVFLHKALNRITSIPLSVKTGNNTWQLDSKTKKFLRCLLVDVPSQTYDLTNKWASTEYFASDVPTGSTTICYA